MELQLMDNKNNDHSFSLFSLKLNAGSFGSQSRKEKTANGSAYGLMSDSYH
jgi:hypothetical protein